MRYAKMSFTHYAMQHGGGIDLSLFMDILTHMPRSTRVVGFGESVVINTSHIIFSCDDFKDVPQGQEPPEIFATFALDPFGNKVCTGVNCSAAADLLAINTNGKQTISMPLPQGATHFKVYGHRDATCLHTIKTYTGMHEVFDYCTLCGVRI